MGTKFLTVVFLFLIVAAFSVNAAAIKKDPAKIKKEAMTFLKKFGYMDARMDGAGSVSAKLRKKPTIKQAIKEFQSFVGLPKTGQLDNATMETMKRPRCGVSDNKRFQLLGTKWETKSVTYSIRNHPEYLSRAHVEYEIARAFQVWSDYTDLTFRLLPYSSRVNIAISFERFDHGDGNSFDGPGSILAHAYQPPTGTTHFDSSERWTINSYEGINLFTTAAHEFGHALGLSHSNIQQALMAPYLQRYTPSFQLHQDDIAGIQRIYGGKTRAVTTKSPPSTTTVLNNGNNRPSKCSSKISQTTIMTSSKGRTLAVNGDQYWPVTSEGQASGSPRPLSEVYPKLPGNMDAGFSIDWERKNNGVYTYFFKGNMYWRYSARGLDTGYPRLITKGFEGIPTNIDAAFVLENNVQRYIYFFKGQQYWRYNTNEISGKDGSQYPLQITTYWKNLPTDLDGAFTTPSRSSYFIKRGRFYKLNPSDFSVSEVKPLFNLC